MVSPVNDPRASSCRSNSPVGVRNEARKQHAADGRRWQQRLAAVFTTRRSVVYHKQQGWCCQRHRHSGTQTAYLSDLMSGNAREHSDKLSERYHQRGIQEEDFSCRRGSAVRKKAGCGAPHSGAAMIRKEGVKLVKRLHHAKPEGAYNAVRSGYLLPHPRGDTSDIRPGPLLDVVTPNAL